jgi:hypothetical protein
MARFSGDGPCQESAGRSAESVALAVPVVDGVGTTGALPCDTLWSVFRWFCVQLARRCVNRELPVTTVRIKVTGGTRAIVAPPQCESKRRSSRPSAARELVVNCQLASPFFS